jgi:hypothetical protein
MQTNKQLKMTKEDFENIAYIELLGESEEMVNEFISYWTEKSLNGKKMRFEKEKVFEIKKRFATWKRNSKKFNPKFEQVAVNVTTQAIYIFKQWDNESN